MEHEEIKAAALYLEKKVNPKNETWELVVLISILIVILAFLSV